MESSGFSVFSSRNLQFGVERIIGSVYCFCDFGRTAPANTLPGLYSLVMTNDFNKTDDDEIKIWRDVIGAAVGGLFVLGGGILIGHLTNIPPQCANILVISAASLTFIGFLVDHWNSDIELRLMAEAGAISKSIDRVLASNQAQKKRWLPRWWPWPDTSIASTEASSSEDQPRLNEIEKALAHNRKILRGVKGFSFALLAVTILLGGIVIVGELHALS